MNYKIIWVIISGLVLLNSCQNTKGEKTEEKINNQFNEEVEKKAIMKVIEAETKCFYDRNYDCWKSCWINENYAFQAWNNSDGTYTSSVGWESVNNRVKAYLESAKPGHPTVKRENIQIKFYSENLAYLIYKQYNSDNANEYFNISQEVRLMEKQNEEWKIVQVSSYWDKLNKINFDEVTF